MVETEAWLYGAELWKKSAMLKGTNLHKEIPHIMPGARDAAPVFGLCQFLARIVAARKIDERTLDTMRRRLESFLKSKGWNGAYLYPLTPEGAQQRSAACIELAELSKQGG